MINVLVHLKVAEQGKWATVFAEAAPFRKTYGSQGVHVYANANNPNEIFILGTYESMDKAQEMFQSSAFREATQKAGVTGMPEVTFLNEVVKLPA